MKIGIIAHLRFPIKEPFSGGLEAHTHMLVRELLARGHEVTLFATPQSDSSLPLQVIHTDLLKLDYTVLPQMRNDEGYQWFHQEHHAYQRLMLELQRSDFDIIHNNALHYLPISMASLLPMPVVTVLHTPPFPWLQGAVLLEQAHGKINYILPSESLQKNWRPFLEHSEVVHNGIDIEQWPYCPNGGEYAVWTGRIVPEKGAHLAIEAALSANIPLRLAGPVQDEEYFEREITPRLNDTIQYVGHLSYEAIPALVGAAAVFLATPCWDEPFGLTVAESLSCGTPVVAFQQGAMQELVKEGVGALVPAADTQAMAAAIPKVINGTQRFNVRAIAEKYFSLKSMVEGYEAIYTRQLQCSTQYEIDNKPRMDTNEHGYKNRV